MPAWRRVLSATFVFLIIAACSDDGPEPVGIMWGSGASGAFVGDTISLVVFYKDAAGDPIGLPRPTLTWSSSRPSVVTIVSESLAVALDTGRVVLTATTSGGPTYAVSVSFEIIPPWQGRLVWSRQPLPGEQPAIALRELPSHDVQQLVGVGYPGTGSGDAALSWDGSRAAATATRTTASGAPVTVFVVDLATGAVSAPLETLPGDQFGAAWLPGDTLMAFLMRAATGYEVFTARPDGGGVQQRTTLRQGVPPFFNVTPDGNLVVELRDGGIATPSDLFEVTLAGDTVRRLTFTPDYNEGGAAVSPNGTLVVYGASMVNGDFTHVWVMNRDGSSPRRLLPMVRVPHGLGPPFYSVEASESSPSWTPDSQWVLIGFAVDPHLRPDGRAYEVLGEIYAIRISDGLAVRLTHSRTSDGQPVFR